MTKTIKRYTWLAMKHLLELNTSVGNSCGEKLSNQAPENRCLGITDPLMSLEPSYSSIQRQTLLHTFVTLPACVNSTTARSFSALKYITNYLRSTMNENRLKDLIIYISKGILNLIILMLSMCFLN